MVMICDMNGSPVLMKAKEITGNYLFSKVLRQHDIHTSQMYFFKTISYRAQNSQQVGHQ